MYIETDATIYRSWSTYVNIKRTSRYKHILRSIYQHTMYTYTTILTGETQMLVQCYKIDELYRVVFIY